MFERQSKRTLIISFFLLGVSFCNPFDDLRGRDAFDDRDCDDLPAPTLDDVAADNVAFFQSAPLTRISGSMARISESGVGSSKIVT
jgi:hypothetical protein